MCKIHSPLNAFISKHKIKNIFIRCDLIRNNINQKFPWVLKKSIYMQKNPLSRELKKFAINKINLISSFPLEEIASLSIFFLSN